jgi:hypothetical protein
MDTTILRRRLTEAYRWWNGHDCPRALPTWTCFPGIFLKMKEIAENELEDRIIAMLEIVPERLIHARYTAVQTVK